MGRERRMILPLLLLTVVVLACTPMTVIGASLEAAPRMVASNAPTPTLSPTPALEACQVRAAFLALAKSADHNLVFNPAYPLPGCLGNNTEIICLKFSSRPRTVYDWLRDPIACVYLAGGVGQKNGAGWENNPLVFRVLLNDVPAEIVQAAAQREKKDMAFDANFSLGLLRFDANFSDYCRDFQSRLTRISGVLDANFSAHLTRISEFFDAIFSALKPLTVKTEPLNPGLTNQPPRKNAKTADAGEPPSVGRYVEAASDSVLKWDFEAILRRLEVNPTSRRRLLEEYIPPEDFLAWLLQAMTMPKVDPLRVAIAWTLDPRKRERADENFKLLARSPGDLRRIALERAVGQSRYSTSIWESAGGGNEIDLKVFQAYTQAFGERQDVAQRLLRLLFGETNLSLIENSAPSGAR